MKKNLIKILLVVLTISALAIFANVVLAEQGTFDTYKDFLNQAGSKGTYNVDLQGQEGYFDTLLGKVIMTVISFTGLIFLGLIIYSGIQWMTAGGNEEKVSEAKKRTLNGVIGLAIALLAFILTNALFTYFDQRFLKQPEGGVETPPGATCEQTDGICVTSIEGCSANYEEINYPCAQGYVCCLRGIEDTCENNGGTCVTYEEGCYENPPLDYPCAQNDLLCCPR